MKKLTALLIALAFTGLAAPAFAQSQDEPEAEFLHFDPKAFTGERDDSGITRYEPVGQAKFDSLTNLKRSFVPEIKTSTNAQALD